MVQYLTQLISIITLAFMKFSERTKIKRYVTKIFEFYLKDKKAYSLVKFKEIQFVLMK